MHRAAYCKIAKVVAVEKKVRRRRDDIIAAVELGISNGRVEAINNKIKVTVRMATASATPTTSWPCSCSGAATASPSSRVAR